MIDTQTASIPATKLDMIEFLAWTEHDRWAHWQKHLHSQCERGSDGSLIIPADLVARWERQIKTPYPDLSEREKESDRAEVYKYWSQVRAFFEARGADPSLP